VLQVAVGQTNKRLNANEPIQTVVRFENPLPKAQALAQFKAKFKMDKANHYVATYSNTDESGRTHQHLQQFYNGLKVEFGVIITHSLNNEVYLINGELYDATTLNTTPSLSAEAALAQLLETKKGATFLWDSKEDAAAMDYKKPTGELVVLPNVRTGEVQLAYKFDIYTTAPLARDEIYVDAHTGAILYSNPIIKHAHEVQQTATEKATAAAFSTSVTGTANNTKYSGSRQIKTQFNPGTNKYILKDDTRGGGIQTFNSARTSSYPTTNFSDTDNNWTTAEYNNTNKDIGALDAHWGTEMTYDFWMNTFNRNSYDGNGSMLKSYIHYRSNPSANLVNAFWNGTVMSYGDGNTSVSILTSIDVCGHEIGHGVCSSTANLAYQNQSGALNEGLSDIWGACIEHYGRTGALTGPYASAVWTIAEDLGSSPFRSMSSPLSKGNPDTYLGTNWTSTGDEGSCVPASGNDQCGVHNNSGVLNHWFYILTAGKSGTNNAPTPHSYAVTGIGMTKSSQITYYAERDYLTSNATYLDMRNATLEVANTLYCGSSPEVIAVTNAWYAVNVGAQYVAYTTDISLKKVVQPLTVACGNTTNPTLTFENTGGSTINAASIAYSIDGGAATSLAWNGSIAACETVDFSITIGALARGTHTILYTLTTSGDGNNANNTKTSLLLVNDAGTVNTTNTFEGATDNLISYDKGNTNTLWQKGQAAGTILSSAVAGNSTVYGTNLSGLYPNSMTAYLVSQCYDLSLYQNPVFQFDMAFDLEADYDYLNVEYTTDGGLTWSILGNATSSTTWYNSANIPNTTNCDYCVGAQWTGEGASTNTMGGVNSDKKTYSWDMSDFGFGGATPQSNIIFRFNFLSDPGVQNEGVLIDNFIITGTPSLSTATNAFDLFSVSPNPSKGIVLVQLTTTENVNVSLYDVRGRICYKKEFDNTTTPFAQELQLGELEKGIYLLNVTSEGKTQTKKIVIN